MINTKLFFLPEVEKRNFLCFFRKHGYFLGVRVGGIFCSCFQSLWFSLLFNNKKISFYHKSDDFCKVVQKNTKNVQLLNLGRLRVCQFSLDLKIIFDLGYFYLYLHITYLRSDKIRYVRWPPTPPPRLKKSPPPPSPFLYRPTIYINIDFYIFTNESWNILSEEHSQGHTAV